MTQAPTISLKQFRQAVQSAVKAAVQKHPKFKFDVPPEVTISYLIRGFPPPPEAVANATVAEVQAFADEVAAHLDGASEATLKARADARPKGVVYSVGGHIVCGIPPAEYMVVKE